nr:hypothetical protein [uncultured archaeon]
MPGENTYGAILRFRDGDNHYYSNRVAIAESSLDCLSDYLSDYFGDGTKREPGGMKIG